MHMIWVLVGMPIFCGLYAIYCVAKDRKEGRQLIRGRAVPSGRRVVSSTHPHAVSVDGHPLPASWSVARRSPPARSEAVHRSSGGDHG